MQGDNSYTNFLKPPKIVKENTEKAENKHNKTERSKNPKTDSINQNRKVSNEFCAILGVVVPINPLRLWHTQYCTERIDAEQCLIVHACSLLLYVFNPFPNGLRLCGIRERKIL